MLLSDDLKSQLEAAQAKAHELAELAEHTDDLEALVDVRARHSAAQELIGRIQKRLDSQLARERADAEKRERDELDQKLADLRGQFQEKVSANSERVNELAKLLAETVETLIETRKPLGEIGTQYRDLHWQRFHKAPGEGSALAGSWAAPQKPEADAHEMYGLAQSFVLVGVMMRLENLDLDLAFFRALGLGKVNHG